MLALPMLRHPLPSIIVSGEGRNRYESGTGGVRYVSLPPPTSRDKISVLSVTFFAVDSRTHVSSEPPRTLRWYFVFQAVHWTRGMLLTAV